jgi:hypothetical protein
MEKGSPQPQRAANAVLAHFRPGDLFADLSTIFGLVSPFVVARAGPTDGFDWILKSGIRFTKAKKAE